MQSILLPWGSDWEESLPAPARMWTVNVNNCSCCSPDIERRGLFSHREQTVIHIFRPTGSPLPSSQLTARTPILTASSLMILRRPALLLANWSTMVTVELRFSTVNSVTVRSVGDTLATCGCSPSPAYCSTQSLSCMTDPVVMILQMKTTSPRSIGSFRSRHRRPRSLPPICELPWASSVHYTRRAELVQP